MEIVYHAIGTIHTPFDTPQGTPIQPVAGMGIQGKVIVDEAYADGLKDLDGFSHIMLFFHLDRSRPPRMLIKPYLDDNLRGVFSTRAPSRPNAIGFSVVRLLGVKGCTLDIENVDMLDGTPLLDIKPYVPRMDVHPAERSGWLDERQDGIGQGRSDDRFHSQEG